MLPVSFSVTRRRMKDVMAGLAAGPIHVSFHPLRRDTHHLSAARHVGYYSCPNAGVTEADDLLRDAARNHQLERAYQVEYSEARTRRRDAEFEAHQKLA